jgi:hypothetical protein
MTLAPVHNGVLIPPELWDAPESELDAYAADVKAGNRAFREAYFACVEGAARLGVDFEELDR